MKPTVPIVLVGLSLLFLVAHDTVATTTENPVNVTMRLYTTQENGPTVVNGTSSQSLDIGDTGSLFAVAGKLKDGQGLCSVMFSGGHPYNDEITNRIRNRVASELEGDGYFWDIEVSNEGVVEGSVALRAGWKRFGRLGKHQEELTRELEMDLPLGSRRLLDMAPFERTNQESSCRNTSYYLELEALPTGHEAMANRDLIYELWFARTRDGRRDEFAAAEIRAGQAEQIPFTVPPLVQSLNGLKSVEGKEITLRTQSKGKVRAWSTGPDELEIQIDPSLHFFLSSPMDGGFASGKGTKLYKADLGETVELELPEVLARITWEASGIARPQHPIEGIEFDDSTVQVDFAPILGDTRYSLLVRVRAGD